jgi:hypothetical protein
VTYILDVFHYPLLLKGIFKFCKLALLLSSSKSIKPALFHQLGRVNFYSHTHYVSFMNFLPDDGRRSGSRKSACSLTKTRQWKVFNICVSLTISSLLFYLLLYSVSEWIRCERNESLSTLTFGKYGPTYLF